MTRAYCQSCYGAVEYRKTVEVKMLPAFFMLKGGFEVHSECVPRLDYT